MGKLSLILVIGAFFLSGLVVHRTNKSALRADEKVWEHQHRVIARDGASTGMSATVRKLAQHLNHDWSTYAESEFKATDVAYNGGTYSVEAIPGVCSILTDASRINLVTKYWPPPAVFNSNRDLIEIRATGKRQSLADDNPLQEHQMVACFLQADWNDPMPPSFYYSFISNKDFDFNGGPDIQSIDGEGNVHSNQSMELGPQVTIVGHATYSVEAGSENKSDQVSSFGSGPAVPMVQFDPEEFRDAYNLPPSGNGSTTGMGTNDDGTNYHFRYDDTPPTLTDGQVIGVDADGNALGTADQPFIWFVNGDLTIGADIQLPAHTIIMTARNTETEAEGTLTFSGNGNVTVTGTDPPHNATDEQLKDWVKSQLIDGHPPLAWYANGNVTINGTPNVVGNFYTNGDFTLDGGGKGGNLIGSIAAFGEITANGGGNGNNFWFVEVGEKNIIPGVLLPGKQIIRLALAEWTDPVLDTTP